MGWNERKESKGGREGWTEGGREGGHAGRTWSKEQAKISMTCEAETARSARDA